MAKIRVSFSTALFALSFLICLGVALLFVDHSRRDGDDSDVAAARKAGDSLQKALVSSSAFGSGPETRSSEAALRQLEHPATPPRLAPQDALTAQAQAGMDS